MATYEELSASFGDEDIRTKIEVACVVIAAEIMSGDDTSAPYSQDVGAHDLRLKWSLQALQRTGEESVYLHKFLFGTFNDQPIATILGATDSTVTTQIKNNIDEIATARYG